MGTRTRKRPDESRKPGQITPEGFAALQEQSEELWKESRVLATAVGVAAAEGDRSENAEYIYGKMKLGQIHGKLRFLGNRLNALTIVRQPPPDDGRVHFGCWVKLEDDETGEELVYRIVGPDETNVELGYISAESPMAMAILGKELDDEIVVARPKGDLNATLVEIRVSEPS